MEYLKKICEITVVPPNDLKEVMDVLRSLDVYVVENSHDSDGIHLVVMKKYDLYN